MIFNVKSINTVYIAGKEVDGMKRPREPPTGGNRMNIGRILPTEAAAILNVSPQFVRVAMQQAATGWDCWGNEVGKFEEVNE